MNHPDKPKRRTFLNDPLQKKKGERKQYVHRVDTVEVQDLIERIYEYIVNGFTGVQICSILCMEDETFTESKFEKLMKYVWEHAQNVIHKDREYVFQLHMDRYEDIYQKSMRMEDSWGVPLDVKKDWHIIGAKCMTALKALKSKEDLLGLHSKSIVLEFNQQKAVVIEKQETRGTPSFPGHDLSKLSLEDKIKLLSLLKECRTVPIEGVQRLVIKKNITEITANGELIRRQIVNNIDNIETIEFEEMPPDVVQQFQAPEIKEEDRELHSGPKFIDEVKEMENRTIDDVKQSIFDKLKEDLKKNAKKK